MFRQIQFLGQRHELHLFSIYKDIDDVSFQATLSKYCRRIHLFRSCTNTVHECPDEFPLTVKKFLDPEIGRQIRSFIKGYDFNVTIVEHIYLASYIDLFLGACVLSEHNIESKVLDRIRDSLTAIKAQIYFSEKIPWLNDFPNDEPRRLALYEDRYWNRYPLRIAVSEADKSEMNARCNYGKTVVVENGTDIGKMLEVDHTSNGVLLMASMLYLPNLDGIFYFVNEIWPMVIEQNPDLILFLVGSNPPPEVRKLSSSKNIQVFPSPTHIEPLARNCAVSVVPLRLGGGTRLKILHALSMGLPTISTSVGCEGLRVTDDVNILVRDAPRDFADAIVGTTSDPRLWNRLRQNGRLLVEDYYDWKHIFEKLEEEITNLASTCRDSAIPR